MKSYDESGSLDFPTLQHGIQCVTWVACGSSLFVQDLSAGLRIGYDAVFPLRGGIEPTEWPSLPEEWMAL
jgi:hypothetical protein